MQASWNPELPQSLIIPTTTVCSQGLQRCEVGLLNSFTVLFMLVPGGAGSGEGPGDEEVGSVRDPGQ